MFAASPPYHMNRRPLTVSPPVKPDCQDRPTKWSLASKGLHFLGEFGPHLHLAR